MCGLHFSVMLLFLDKRDEGSFSDLISQWERLLWKPPTPMLIENRAQDEGRRMAEDELFGGLISVHRVRTGL